MLFKIGFASGWDRTVCAAERALRATRLVSARLREGEGEGEGTHPRVIREKELRTEKVKLSIAAEPTSSGYSAPSKL
jgi:hypothetical protein